VRQFAACFPPFPATDWNCLLTAHEQSTLFCSRGHTGPPLSNMSLLSSFFRRPHGQHWQLCRIEDSICHRAHHPAFQPASAMGGDGDQVTRADTSVDPRFIVGSCG
jgi:hypothetical protein